MKDYVYFDLETQRTADDVGGWGNKDKMGMSVGVTYSSKLGEYRVYGENDAQALIEQLMRADLVIGFNHISFDYEVLQGYTVFNIAEQVLSLDLMVDLEETLGHRPKLDAVAAASLGTGKSADGLQAIRWWRQGKIMEIAEYCCFDVKVTKMVHEYGATHGKVKYLNRFQQEQEIEVNWQHPDAEMSEAES